MTIKKKYVCSSWGHLIGSVDSDGLLDVGLLNQQGTT